MRNARLVELSDTGSRRPFGVDQDRHGAALTSSTSICAPNSPYATGNAERCAARCRLVRRAPSVRLLRGRDERRAPAAPRVAVKRKLRDEQNRSRRLLGTERFIRPRSSGKMRRPASFSAIARASLSVVIAPTLRSASKPSPISPVVCGRRRERARARRAARRRASAYREKIDESAKSAFSRRSSTRR